MIPLFKVYMNNHAIENVTKTLTSGFISQGSQVENFENELKIFLRHNLLLTLNSATSGLTLALRLLVDRCDDLYWMGFDKENDVILTPSLTCFATTSSILANGIKNIVWIDSDPNTCNVSFDDIRNKLSVKTKIIYIVHWGGQLV